MNQLLTQILTLPRQQKIGVLAGLIILLLIVGYFYIYLPGDDKVTKLAEEITGVRGDRDKKKALSANLPKLQKELQEWDAKLKAAVAQLPDRKEIPDLLSSLSTKAREAGLEILLFRPRAENFQEFYAEIPVDIVVRGGFFNAVTFFDEVGKLNRLVNIDNIDLKNPKVGGDQVALEISTLATTYRFLDEAERKKVAEEKAKAAAKK
ncbi:MAG TPA: type 4a pilus biogenesis protein PilO [Candidatus Binatia bacterium]|nr:type 4a pilus biogenesis protein PilO [Candidatus Binatia bacterium]HSF59136.1 type 4a pilus biogenesis protein PilO [Candidatus Binatia bacterium]